MIKIYNLTDDSMKKALELNEDGAYWDYPIEDLPYLVERSTERDEDGETYDCNCFALYGGRLYEIPEDIIDELEEL